jgi:glyoxylase-like metal-dependent hydrolase (beta-lactamase superfamily II)
MYGLPNEALDQASSIRRFSSAMAKLTALMSALFFVLASLAARADENILDQYPQSLLYSKPVEFIPNVWTSIGATAPSGYENAGHNNNLSFLVTGDGVVVINGGGSYGLAKALHDEIKNVTDQPVKLVINENGQGHAMLGNGYWGKLGVPIIAHEDAAAEFDERGANSLESAQGRLRERADNTTLKLPDETFKERKEIKIGSMNIVLLYSGPAHSAGDIQVWLPDQKLVIAGDIAFNERMLPIFDGIDTAAWLGTWDNVFEKLGAVYVIPGHGHPTNMAQVRHYTRNYLIYLRKKIREHIDAGGDLEQAFHVDQSPFRKWHTFKEVATRNAGRVFEQMEFE